MNTFANFEFTAYIGIDWADTKHDICIQPARSDQREFDRIALQITQIHPETRTVPLIPRLEPIASRRCAASWSDSPPANPVDFQTQQPYCCSCGVSSLCWMDVLVGYFIQQVTPPSSVHPYTTFKHNSLLDE